MDFLLLQRYPHPGTPRFRHYGWRAPACTFGYAQKIATVRELLAAQARTQHSDTDAGRIDLLDGSKTQAVELADYQEVRVRHFHQTLDRYLAGQHGEAR
mgnify:CR=1 FL=1